MKETIVSKYLILCMSTFYSCLDTKLFIKLKETFFFRNLDKLVQHPLYHKRPCKCHSFTVLMRYCEAKTAIQSACAAL